MEKKKKSNFILYLFLYLFILYFVLGIASVVNKDDTIFDIINNYGKAVKEKPFFIHWNNSYSLKAIALYTVFYFLFILNEMTKTKNFMPGKEHGNAKWADIKSLNKALEDKIPHHNRIYSENLRISMDGRKTQINNNVLVIGGSGSGKSFYLLTPNIYNARSDDIYPGNYIFTDPKGELMQRNAKYLK